MFDGRVRYDLHSQFKRMEMVKAEKGYEGPAVVCALYFTPISGYVPDRAAIKYLIELRDAEVWLAPIAGTRVLVPFRFSMPTPLGPGVLQAKQFVSVAEPHARSPRRSDPNPHRRHEQAQRRRQTAEIRPQMRTRSACRHRCPRYPQACTS